MFNTHSVITQNSFYNLQAENSTRHQRFIFKKGETERKVKIGRLGLKDRLFQIWEVFREDVAPKLVLALNQSVDA